MGERALHVRDAAVRGELAVQLGLRSRIEAALGGSDSGHGQNDRGAKVAMITGGIVSRVAARGQAARSRRSQFASIPPAPRATTERAAWPTPHGGEMVSIPSLWLPILLSAVFVFFASFLVHMLLGYHARDLRKVPQEDAVMAALRPFDLAPGDYMMPCAQGMQAMRSPEFRDKRAKGPVAVMTVY